jgi:hypothetical protein
MCSTAPRSRNDGGGDVKAGTEFLEHTGGQPLGENVGELRARWNMKNSSFSKGDPVTNEVKIYLDMLGSLVLNRIGGHVHSTDVVTIYNGGPAWRMM